MNSHTAAGSMNEYNPECLEHLRIAIHISLQEFESTCKYTQYGQTGRQQQY